MPSTRFSILRANNRVPRISLRFATIVLLAAIALPFHWTASAADPSEGTLTGLMFYATNTDGTEAIEKIQDSAGDRERFANSLGRVFPARNFVLVGKHTVAVSQKYSIWLKPSPQFPLQIENTGQTDDGGLALYWILWQKEPLPTKDRELVKSNTVLKRGAPLFIGGPKWRDGRLIFVVRMD
ncbi:MAG: hypothetical protein ACR2OZ_16230 [Verrucomicrobiales bacterium]